MLYKYIWGLYLLKGPTQCYSTSFVCIGIGMKLLPIQLSIKNVIQFKVDRDLKLSVFQSGSAVCDDRKMYCPVEA